MQNLEREVREITTKDMEPEEARIVDVSVINLLANFSPKIPENSLTTLADTMEKVCRDFYRAIQANGVKHARISVDHGKTSGKIFEVLKTEEKFQRFMAVAGAITLNIYPNLDADTIAEWYGLGSRINMALLVPELCRQDGHFKFTRGTLLMREMIRMFSI